METYKVIIMVHQRILNFKIIIKIVEIEVTAKLTIIMIELVLIIKDSDAFEMISIIILNYETVAIEIVIKVIVVEIIKFMIFTII